MPKLSEPKVRQSHMLNLDGTARDLWPTVPTRDECVAVGFPTLYADYTALERLWPALNVEEKEALGFTRAARAMQIERLIASRKGRPE